APVPAPEAPCSAVEEPSARRWRIGRPRRIPPTARRRRPARSSRSSSQAWGESLGRQVGRRVCRPMPLVCERSARSRSAVNLARGGCPPLAAVRPRLLGTDGGDRAGGGLGRSGGGLGRTNREPIALGGGRGGGVGVCLGIGSDGSGRSGVGLHFRIGGERRDHGGADCKRHHASCEPEDGHLTTHPAAPVASETLSGVLGVSRGGAPKGSRPRAGFPGIFRPKCRTRREWRAKAPPSGTQKRRKPARPARGYGRKPPKPQPVARLPWPDVKPVETTTTR